MTILNYEEIALLRPCSTDFQTHLERRFTLGRFRGIGYPAGLEIYAAQTGSRKIVTRFVISLVCDKCDSACKPCFAQQGRFPRRPRNPSFVSFHCVPPCCVLIPHGQGLIHITAESGLPTA